MMTIDQMIAEIESINNTCSCNTLGKCDCINNAIERYDTFIKNFFSCDGEATGIKNIYSKLKDDPEARGKHICVIDLNRSYDIYNEYHEGMIKFISEIIDVDNKLSENNTDIESLKMKLQRAKECDKAFIDSLFNGENNKEEDSCICDALKNVEFLIDFIPQMMRFKESCFSLCELKQNGEPSSLVCDSLDLLYSSISEYCCKCIKSVIQIYTKIFEIVCGEDRVEESVVYRLF